MDTTFVLSVLRQMEHAVACLKDASDLAKDIAVGRKPVENSKFLQIFVDM